MDIKKLNIIHEDPWRSLRAFTNARIALGRTGNAMPLKAILQMKLAHAHARDAVYSQLATTQLMEQMRELFDDIIMVESKINSRSQYLKRPDLGKILNDLSVEKIKNASNNTPGISIVIADGLSAKAINNHALPVLQNLVPLFKKAGCQLLPLCIATQARVALGDHIGYLFKANLTLMLIGERPGLTSPESMSAYITYKPELDLFDERRNCISNIRPEGIQYNLAAEKIFYLIQQSLRLNLSGTKLKDDQHLLTGAS